DATGDRVLDRNDGELGLAGLHGVHRRIERRARQRRHVGKRRTASHVRIRASFALERDNVAWPRPAAHCPCHLNNSPPTARQNAKNLAKSVTCDVPPREPTGAIGYY